MIEYFHRLFGKLLSLLLSYVDLEKFILKSDNFRFQCHLFDFIIIQFYGLLLPLLLIFKDLLLFYFQITIHFFQLTLLVLRLLHFYYFLFFQQFNSYHYVYLIFLQFLIKFYEDLEQNLKVRLDQMFPFYFNYYFIVLALIHLKIFIL